MTEDFNDQEEFSGDDIPEKEPMPEMEEPSSFKDTAGELDMDITDDDKLWALLAYVLTPLVPIIIYLMADKKDRPFLRAHNAQAFIWGLILFALGLVSSFLCGIPSLILWLVGCYWGWQAYQGEMVNIPVITDFVKNQGWA